MRRSGVKAAVLGLVTMLLGPPLAGAQEQPPAKEDAPPAAASPPGAAQAPSAPIPYSQLAPKPKPKPAALAPAPKPVAPPARPAEPGARLQPNQPIPPGELEAFVDGLVEEAMARDHIAGVTVSVVQGGQTVLKKGYGFASFSPVRRVDPDRTLFRIGSISKTFTWIAVMKAVEEGKIRLDAPVNAYLPPELQVPNQGFDQPIRMLDLMDHAPGFEDRALGQLFEDNYDQVRPLTVYLRYSRPKRVRPPGVVSSYSNYGAALAGEAAANVAKTPYERLIEDEILVPARLSHTTFREPHPARPGLPAPMPASLAADVAQGYSWAGAGFRARPYEYIGQVAPAGAASSTAADMARYMLLHLGNGVIDGVSVYGPRTAEAFRTPIRATAPGINGWAHGLVVMTLPGGHVGYGHDGGTLSFFSDMVLVPDLGLGVFVSTNTPGGAAFSDTLAPAIVRQFYAPPQSPPRTGSPELAAQGAAFDGYYLTTRRPYSGLEGFVRHLAQAGLAVHVTSDGRLLVVDPGGVSAYVPEGPVSEGRFIGAPDDSRLAFRMQDGRAVSFVNASDSQAFERTGFWMKPSTLELFAALSALAALATLIGAAMRTRRELRQSGLQARASLMQSIQGGLWLTAMLLFGLWTSRAASDLAWVMYNWPGVLLILGSTCALVAAALTIPSLAALPGIWSGGRRVESWTWGRKLAFSITVGVYLAFSLMLVFWGALAPWSG